MRRRRAWWVVVVAAAVAAVAAWAPGQRDQAVTAPATSVDAAGDVVVDAVEVVGTTATVTGWTLDGGPVQIVVDGIVVATVTADISRPDVAAAYGLSQAAGFSATVSVPSDAFLICATTPDAVAAPRSCNRPLLDLSTHRLVAFYGVPGVPVLGTLGSGTAQQALARLEAQAAPYVQPDRPVMLGFEIIATVAQASPGSDGDYSAPIPSEDILEYLEVMRTVEGHVILDFQPGRAEFLDQMQAIEHILIEPDVHVALDPEWDMLSNQVPAQVVGHTPAAEINAVMNYLDDLIRTHRLPPKMVVVHQFQEQMIRNRPDLAPPETITLVLQMDGHGPPSLKTGNYARLADPRFDDGFKLFYLRDVPLMSPAAVLVLEPDAELVTYQ